MRHAGFTSASLLALACAALAPRVTEAAEVEMSGGFPVTSRAKIYPLAKIKRGDKGIGYTVFEEDVAKPFGVEVLGLMENMLGPGKHVILARLSGKEIEFTGVISGMSGSPVYIDGLLVGAVAYRFGAFSKEPIAGITPIESMIAVYDTEAGPRPSQSASMRLPSGSLGTRLLPEQSGRRGIAVADLRERGGLPAVQLPKAAPLVGPYDAKMIETPIVLSGLQPAVAGELRAELERAGFVTMSAGTANTAPAVGGKKLGKRTVAPNKAGVAGRVRAAPIAPASPICAVLMRGDINIAATGTVTFVEDGEVLAFGHPFLGYGTVAFPMTTASILNTLASPYGSYKMGAAADEVGSITHDRLTAIAGRIGGVAEMIPMRVKVSGFDATSPKRESVSTANVEMIDDPTWLPTLIGAAVANTTLGRLNHEVGGTVEMTARIVVGDRTLEIADTYAEEPPVPVAFFAARDVANIVAMITHNNLVRAELKSVDVELKVKREIALAVIEQVVPDRTVVFPGEKLELTAKLRPYLQAPRWVRLSVEIPKDVRGDVEVFVGGGIEMDRREGDLYGERFPEDLDALLGMLSERRPARGIYAAVFASRSGLRASSDVLTSLPPSMRATLSGEPGRTYKMIGETLGKVSTLPYPDVISGSIAVPITVVRDGSGS